MKLSRIITTIGGLLIVFDLLCLVDAQHTKMIEVDRSYDGSEVTLGVGDVVVLSLAENPTTGFRWDFAAKPEPACMLVKSTFEPATGSPGKGGTHHWRFQAVRPGSGKIELEYRRRWEKGTPPSQTFKLSVRVQSTR